MYSDLDKPCNYQDCRSCSQLFLFLFFWRNSFSHAISINSDWNEPKTQQMWKSWLRWWRRLVQFLFSLRCNNEPRNISFFPCVKFHSTQNATIFLSNFCCGQTASKENQIRSLTFFLLRIFFLCRRHHCVEKVVITMNGHVCVLLLSRVRAYELMRFFSYLDTHKTFYFLVSKPEGEILFNSKVVLFFLETHKKIYMQSFFLSLSESELEPFPVILFPCVPRWKSELMGIKRNYYCNVGLKFPWWLSFLLITQFTSPWPKNLFFYFLSERKKKTMRCRDHYVVYFLWFDGIISPLIREFLSAELMDWIACRERNKIAGEHKARLKRRHPRKRQFPILSSKRQNLFTTMIHVKWLISRWRWSCRAIAALQIKNGRSTVNWWNHEERRLCCGCWHAPAARHAIVIIVNKLIIFPLLERVAGFLVSSSTFLGGCVPVCILIIYKIFIFFPLVFFLRKCR